MAPARLALAGTCIVLLITACLSAAELSLQASPQLQDTAAPIEDSAAPLERWSFQLGAAYITGNTIDELLLGQFDAPDGPAEGMIYLLQASYTLRELEWSLWGNRVRPHLQLAPVLGVVDERGRSPFGQYSLGLTLRWRDFPWNRYLYTNFETGVGLTYSEHVLAVQRQRHPDRERSHLEIYWPIELTFAHPRHRRHQLVLFLHHHSGGVIFHRGGSNSLGIGYRLVLGER